MDEESTVATDKYGYILMFVSSDINEDEYFHKCSCYKCDPQEPDIQCSVYFDYFCFDSMEFKFLNDIQFRYFQPVDTFLLINYDFYILGDINMKVDLRTFKTEEMSQLELHWQVTVTSLNGLDYFFGGEKSNEESNEVSW